MSDETNVTIQVTQLVEAVVKVRSDYHDMEANDRDKYLLSLIDEAEFGDPEWCCTTFMDGDVTILEIQ